MVKFGTRDGPIIPPAPTPPPAAPRSYREPAPVYEQQDDIPNPTKYTPIQPHQYRTKIYKYRPNPNLILGTPLDKKYTPYLDKYSVYRKPRKTPTGLGYTGPQVFDVQPYEAEEQQRRYEQLQRYQQIPVASPRNFDGASTSRTVPEIGILYSSGVRYYIPQIVYYPQSNHGDYDDVDNSVYEANDLKYYQQKLRRY